MPASLIRRLRSEFKEKENVPRTVDSYSSIKKVAHFTVYMSAKERRQGREKGIPGWIYGIHDLRLVDYNRTRCPAPPSVRPGPSAMPHSERRRGRRSRRRVMNGRAVARRSEFLKKLSKKMTVRSASTINKMGGKSNEIQTHSNNGHNPPLHQSTPHLGEMFSWNECARGGLYVFYSKPAG